MLDVENLSHSFGRHPVLHQVSFTLEKGTLCGLFGPNGSGKTTLFKCCLKFLIPDKGDVRIQGRDIRSLDTRQMAKLVAFVPQHHRSAFSYTVRDLVLMGRTPHLNRFFSPKSEDLALTDRAMELVGITPLANRSYNTLSGGQQQLVLIARAIAQDTDLIFLDEPTSALDFKNQILLWKTLRQVADRGTSILACSHDPNHVAWFCDRTVVLGQGRIQAVGAPGQIFSQSLMDQIYQDTCRVSRTGELKIILPAGLTQNTAPVELKRRKIDGNVHRLEPGMDRPDGPVEDVCRKKLSGILGR